MNFITNITKLLLCFAVFILFIAGAYAENIDNLDLTLGITGGAMPEYSGAGSNKNIVLPLVIGKYKINKRNAMLFNPYDGLSYAYSPNKNISYGVKIDYRQGRDSSDNPELSGMKNIDTAFEVGPWIKYKNGKVTYMANIGVDTLGSYNGLTAELGVKYDIPINKEWKADIGANILYGDENYASTYYGVSQSQATATRLQHNAKAGFQELTLSSGLTYFIDEKTFLRGDFGYKRLMGDAQNSPIVTDANQFSFFVSVGYKF